MALPAGTRLGPYEILARIGAGGMGEVYRAIDSRLNREVAIKVSAERFSDRFEREARAVAALNHPNVCTLHDVGPNYLVMELVEGDTLAERIKQGAMPLEEALAVAKQLADALEAAHEKGITHRDLKPANIKITQDGVVKVLDFGLAKMADPISHPGSDPEQSPTMTLEAATRVGTVLGTAGYMAPEQARGKAVDKRADIWAFGVIVHEMLLGRRLFQGETISDTLVAVLKDEPDWHRVPARVQRLLKNCLEKDPKRRLRDIGDALRMLEDAPERAPGGLRWKIAAGVLAAAFAIALWGPWRVSARPIERASMRVDLDLGPDVSFASSITGAAVVLSPDGTRMAFVSQGQDEVRHLFTRRLDHTKTTQLPGTEGAYAPFFSPDGQWLGFFAQGKLKKLSIEGGEPISLCDAPASRGGSWSEDGTIIAALDQQTGLSQVPSDGGIPVRITQLNREAGETTHRWPQVLPGGTAVVFIAGTAYGHYEMSDIVIVSLKDRQRKTVLRSAGTFPRYLPSGQLTYVTKGAIFAVPFDLKQLEARGPAVSLGEVLCNRNLGFAEFDFSRSGTLAYRVGGSRGLRSIQWLDDRGATVPLGPEPGYILYPRASPEGGRITYVLSQEAFQDLWIYDFNRGTKIRLTSDQNASFPIWSANGKFVVYHATGGMYWARADGAGKPQLLTKSLNIQLPTSFTQDGARIIFSESLPEGGGEIRTLPLEYKSGELKAGASELFMKTAAAIAYGTTSPDGRWLAYANVDGGRYEVYVRAFPDNGSQVQVSNAGGILPMWSRNGQELFYRTEDHRIMAANYTVKGELFVAEKPRPRPGRPLANSGAGGNLDIAPDGKRFVVLMPTDVIASERQSHVTLVANFFDEVQRRTSGHAK